MKKKSFTIKLILFVLLVCAILFVARFSGHAFLKMYVEAGTGSCLKIPILCMMPTETIINPVIDDKFINSLIPYKFPKMNIAIPKGFSVMQETIKKVYYKKKKLSHAEKVVYLLHQPSDFFVGLYPQLKKQGVKDDYEFIRRIMYANLNRIKNVTDAFFVIMKGIFTPDLGDQKNVKMVEFQTQDKRGFINYNLSNTAFDCNVISEKGGFFKVYIKDKEASLDLAQVLAIINTLVNVDKA
ncbi:MAG: hypothetical protein AMJ95_07010 [Omnitrophica WOR_2 bacterium SM23_72]|nr:MAG: hypothetical protein AMJ95_07010 [Omnitrophica WOR_2 bacterium SM23_72]